MQTLVWAGSVSDDNLWRLCWFENVTSHPEWWQAASWDLTSILNFHLELSLYFAIWKNSPLQFTFGPRLHFLPIAHCPLHNTWCICSILRHVFSECFLTVLWVFSECEFIPHIGQSRQSRRECKKILFVLYCTRKGPLVHCVIVYTLC